MDQELLKTYSVRVTQANRTDLVVITYEIIIDSIKSAELSCNQSDFVSFRKDIKRVQKLLNELTGSLDYHYNLSFQLLRLYQYAGEIAAKALFKKDTSNFDSLLSIIEKLKLAFEEVAKLDHGSQVMSNAQTIYAGLTYGKNSLNEVYMDKNYFNRGFQA